jgi:hypothetical protein
LTPSWEDVTPVRASLSPGIFCTSSSLPCGLGGPIVVVVVVDGSATDIRGSSSGLMTSDDCGYARLSLVIKETRARAQNIDVVRYFCSFTDITAEPLAIVLLNNIYELYC